MAKKDAVVNNEVFPAEPTAPSKVLFDRQIYFGHVRTAQVDAGQRRCVAIEMDMAGVVVVFTDNPVRYWVPFERVVLIELR